MGVGNHKKGKSIGSDSPSDIGKKKQVSQIFWTRDTWFLLEQSHYFEASNELKYLADTCLDYLIPNWKEEKTIISNAHSSRSRTPIEVNLFGSSTRHQFLSPSSPRVTASGRSWVRYYSIRSFSQRVCFLPIDIPDEGANTGNIALLIKANLT